MDNKEEIAKLSQLLTKLSQYTMTYEITIQFWGHSNTNVFITKGGVDLTDFGGLGPIQAIEKTIEYLDRINGKK